MRLEPFYTLNAMRKEHGVRKTFMLKLDESVTRFTAGLGINDIRSVLRGDPAGNPARPLHQAGKSEPRLPEIGNPRRIPIQGQ